jgi:hypothetical protein
MVEFSRKNLRQCARQGIVREVEEIENALKLLRTDAASYPVGVVVWMRVMAVSYFSGIIFAWKKPGARWVILTMMLTFCGLILGKLMLPELSRSDIGSIVHVVLWPILLFLMWRPGARAQLGEQLFDRIYFAWLIWITVLMAISLMLDVIFLL